MPFNYDGKYLNLGSDYKYDYVYINYYGTPIDNMTGTPLIVRGHEAACEAYCVHQMYYEDILTDKISIDAKNRIENDLTNKTRACRGDFRHITRQDMEKVNMNINVIAGSTCPILSAKTLLPLQK